jgi:hypothetical protein
MTREVEVSTATSAKTAIPNGLDSRVIAFWRPAEGRHNIAEIALHHACCARSVRGQLSGTTPEPFVMEGEDWFALPDGYRLGWPQIREVVDGERFDLVLGITCHAVYHAGQVQLLKRLRGE